MPRNRSDPRPEISASQMKSNVASLENLGPEVAAQVRAMVPAHIFDEVEGATRVGWMPIEHDIELTEAVTRCAGRKALWSWSVESMLESFDAPFLRPAITGLVRLFGLNPGKMLKHAPRAFGHVYRNAGRLIVAPQGPARTVLEWRDAPARALRSPDYPTGIAASFAALFEVCHVQGRVGVTRSSGATLDATIVFDVSWGPARGERV